MKRNFKSRLLSGLLICSVLLPSLFATSVTAADSYPFSASDTEVASALDYLRGQQGTDGSISDFATSAWAVMAIAAAGEDPNNWQVDTNPSVVDYLAANAGSATTATDYARMLLAIAAANEDPTNFGGIDFVYLLEAEYDGTQLGDRSLLNDDFWGVLGLVAAGESETSPIITDSVAFILSNQGADGGWSWGVEQASDVDDTAAAIMALIAAGQSTSSQAITDGLTYLKSTQMENGGFESWGSTNSATDSWGIDAIVAAGEDPTSAGWASGIANDSIDDLLTFQNPDGSFNWTLETPSNKELMTSYALTALLGEPYPVAVLESQPEEEGETITVRIEGQNNTIWSGTVTVTESTIIDEQGGEHSLAEPTALGALDEASQEGGFPYVVQETAFGLYVYSINGEEPSGMSGWMYRVDYESPWVGAADFILNETTPPDLPHEEVLFYYGESYEAPNGEWGPFPLKVEVDKTEVDVDEQFTVTVTRADTESPCEGATVHADQDYTTNQNGVVTVAIGTDVTVNVYAEKEGFIRSNRVTVTVGEGTQGSSSQDVNLIADILPAISFTVTPMSIDFGALGPRDVSAPRQIIITNTGAWDIEIACGVTDDADDLYVEGIKLDDEVWEEFSVIVERHEQTACFATLTVPEDYTLIGEQDGTIIFWAAEAPSQ